MDAIVGPDYDGKIRGSAIEDEDMTGKPRKEKASKGLVKTGYDSLTTAMFESFLSALGSDADEPGDRM